MSKQAPPSTRHMEKWSQAILSGEETPPTDGNKSLSQSIYESLGNSKKVLATLCIGLNNHNQSPLINMDESPWSSEPKATIKPANRELAMEVLRRQRMFLTSDTTVVVHDHVKPLTMKPKNKPREVLLEWLNDWPILDHRCVQFLTAEASRVRSVLESAINESNETAVAMQHGAWSGPTPYLRLIHCIIDNEKARSAYLKRNAVKTREELDATNSPNKGNTAFEVIAEVWNDPSFNPCTSVSDCHQDFAQEIPLPHSKVAKLVPADGLGIRNRLSNIRATLLRIIDKWEQSGQGDGGRLMDMDGDCPVGWGTLEGRSQHALDTRANFLGDAPTWYLYFWEAADRYQLLATTLQRLSGSVGAPSGSTPQLCVSRARRQQSDSITGKSIEINDSTPGESWDGSTEKINAVLQSLIESSEQDRLQERELHVKKRVNVVNDTIDNYEVQFAITEKDIYQQLIAKKREELKQLETELEEIVQLKKRKLGTD
jgi:hypothetical protein